MWKAGSMVVLAVLAFAAGASAGSNDDLLEILDLHEKLATNEAFQKQSKLLGVYLEEARTMGPEEKKIIYRKVLSILHQIAQAPAPESKPQSHPMRAELLGPQVQSGSANVEWFKTETLDVMPETPVKRAAWKRDLWIDRDGDDTMPAKGDPAHVARITFYIHAKAAGQHEFTVTHGKNEVRLLLGGILIVDLAKGGDQSKPGTVELEQGYHRIDLLLRYAEDPAFSVSVLLPGETEKRILPQSDLYVRKVPSE